MNSPIDNTQAQPESGFTVLEMVISLVVATGVLLAATSMVSTGTSGYAWMVDSSSANDDARSAIQEVSSDLRSANPATLSIEERPDGSSRVTLHTAIGGTGGTVLWGAYDAALGDTTSKRSRVGHSVRYTVVSERSTDGSSSQTLMRQLLDPTDQVLSERVVARHLSDSKGFLVEQVGTMWRVTLRLDESLMSSRSGEFSLDVYCWNRDS